MANATRPIVPVNGGVRQVSVLMNLGEADYDGLQTLVRYHNSHLDGSVSYTLSKATNTTEPDGNGIGPNESNIARLGEVERGPSVVDQRHRAVIALSYRLPYDITIGTLTQLASARPFNSTTGVDNNGDGANNDRPVVNGQVIDKSAFRGTGTQDVAVFIEGRIKASKTTTHPAPPGGLQSPQPRELPGPRADRVRQRRNARHHLRPARGRGQRDDRPPGVRERRPAADVPAAGPVHLLTRV